MNIAKERLKLDKIIKKGAYKSTKPFVMFLAIFLNKHVLGT